MFNGSLHNRCNVLLYTIITFNLLDEMQIKGKGSTIMNKFNLPQPLQCLCALYFSSRSM